MKNLDEYLNETIGGGSQLNEADEVKLQPGMACLIQYVFKNGFKDTKLTNMIYEPDFNALDPTQCNITVPFICHNGIENTDEAIDNLSKALENDIKANKVILKNVHNQLWVRCPTAKIVPLNAGEHVKSAASFVYFNGHWDTMKETDKLIKAFIDDTLKVTCTVFH